MAKLTASQREFLNEIFLECQLDKGDTYANNQFQIITRAGIEKIQATKNIAVEYTLERCERDFVVVRATGQMPGGQSPITTFGSATPENCRSKYLVEMAEKRALARCVLKVAGLYRHGFMGKDEFEGDG